MPRALLFDVGEVMMRSSWEVLDELEARIGRPIPGRGPLDPTDDPDWMRHLRGEIGSYEYWNRKAATSGFDGHLDLWKAMSIELGGDMFAPDALALIAEARAAGVACGILSNDLVGSSTREWVDSRPEFRGFDVFVDATEFGERKPAPGPYLEAIADFGLPAEEIVFLDDTPACIEGARDVGMVGLHVNPLQRGLAFDRARRLVGLSAPSDGERLVAAAEAAYAARDLDAAMRLFHPDATVLWNGRRVAQGWAEARRFHVERLGFPSAGSGAPWALHKRLRAQDADTIAVEWHGSWTTGSGRVRTTVGAELWTMRYDLVIELQAFESISDGA